MGAKKKFNVAYISGAVLVAGLLGWSTSSFGVFCIALVVLLALSVYAGEIR